MSVPTEQGELLSVINSKTEQRLTVPVVSNLYEIYKTTGCLTALAKLVARMPNTYQEPLIHTLGTHVTKEKPVFVYAISESSGIDQSRVASLSASVDMLWSLSLIVDDIEDNDTVRAGKESAWVKFGKSKALSCVQAGVLAVQDGIEEHFGIAGRSILDKYISRALKSVRHHKFLTFDTTMTDLEENYTNRNDFYCAAPVEIISSTSTKTVDKVAINALRGVTVAGQILNDLKDIWPQFSYIRPNSSDIRNHLVTIPIKQMYDGFTNPEQTVFKQLWNEDLTQPESMDRLIKLVKASGIKDQIVQRIKRIYYQSISDFESTVSNPNLRALFRQWVTYKIGQCEF